MTLETLESARATAGANYSAAVAQYHTALVELAALDQALNSVTGNSGSIRSFGPLPDPVQFRHPVYAPDVGGHWQTDVATRRNEILEGNI
jgi:hypothetical protein